MGKRRRQAPPEPQERVPKKPLTKEIIQRIENWAEEAANHFGLALFDVVVKSGWQIEITIDSKEGATPGKGITVQQCGEVSRYVEALLDVDDDVPERYTLEVSSPGLDRPLTKPAHYTFSIGRMVMLFLKEKIETSTGKKTEVVTGTLTNFNGDTIELHDLDDEGVTHQFKLSDVAKARLTYDFSGDKE